MFVCYYNVWNVVDAVKIRGITVKVKGEILRKEEHRFDDTPGYGSTRWVKRMMRRGVRFS